MSKQNSRIVPVEGERYGRLVVVGYSDAAAYWEFRCDCGALKRARHSHVRSGLIASCGCLRFEKLHAGVRTTHGQTGTSLYGRWQAMLRRCEDPSNRAYDRYGGRGISVCERWHDFTNFRADLGEPPEGLSLDRIDNDGNYEPGNVRWATSSEQMRNRRPHAHKRHRDAGGRFT